MRRAALVPAACLAAACCAQAPLPARAATTGLSGLSVQALAWFGGTAYAGTDEGLYRLAGSQWTAVTQVPSTESVQALAVVGSTLVAGTDAGAIRSGDGSVWSSAGLSNQNVASLAASGSVLIAGTGHDNGADGAAFRSDDAGQTWSPATALPATEGLPGAQVQAVLQPATGQPALAGTAGGGAFHSATGSGGWSDDSSGLSSRWVTAFWRDPANPAAVLAGTDDGLDQSSGGAWSTAAFPVADPWVQALAGAADGSPLAGTYDGGVYQRRGGAWTSLAGGLPSVLSLVAVPAAQGGGVLAGTFDGVHCIACSASLGAAAPPATSRPGATPLPAAGSRPGQSGTAARPSTSASAGASAGTTPQGTPVAGVAGGSTPGGGSGGVNPVYLIGAGLVALSGVITWLGRRRSGRGGPKP